MRAFAGPGSVTVPDRRFDCQVLFCCL